jgi:hypothetical protein
MKKNVQELHQLCLKLHTNHEMEMQNKHFKIHNGSKLSLADTF